ncbi:MAG: type I-B CRISPR-associated protein Cas5b [Saprospiraceae bacterium]
MPQKLISFDLCADFGFFKKPDVNVGLVMGYNMLHKPALLGILGAIAGLRGYERKGELPEYYQVLRELKVGIEPINPEPDNPRHEQGNFQKTALTYTNTVGYANADGNLIITEQTLVRPAYRCYVLLDLSNETQAVLYERISKGEAAYLPYLGKNEFSASWDFDTVLEYQFIENPAINKAFKIRSIFSKKAISINQEIEIETEDEFKMFDFSTPADESFMYFERLPFGFNEKLMQYNIGDFALTNFLLNQKAAIPNLYYLPENEYYIQIF